MNLRQYEIVQDVDKLKVDLQATFMKYKTIKQWAYIVHDKDDTRPHYHIYINFGKSSCDSLRVAEWFGLGYVDDKGVEHTGEQFIEKVKGRKADMLMYLTHENESQKYKHIYDRSEVHSNFDVAVEIEKAKVLGDFEHYSYAQQLEYVNSLPIDEKVSAFNKLEKLWKIHCQSLVLQTDRKLDVVFICGKGGTGKTYYAKKLLTEMDLDFCISSSSNDPFQDYLGQKAIILDDLRDVAFKDGKGDGFEDLLKILDNNTASSVKSRFNNKVFNGEVIVITSSVPLKYWFKDRRLVRDGFDDLYQLYRRIGLYVEVTTDKIAVYKQISKYGEPCGAIVEYVNEVPALIASQQNENIGKDFLTVFNKMCPAADLLF